MSYQGIIPMALAYEHKRADDLKQSYVFNASMADHYFQQYEQHCLGWKFTRAAFCFIKWQQYHRKAASIELQLKFNSFSKN